MKKKLIVVFCMNIFCVIAFAEFPGVVRIHISYEGRTGTGFFINQSLLVTAFHVINLYTYKGKETVDKYITFSEQPFHIRYPISEIVALDAKYDIAVLKVDGYVPKAFYPLTIRDLDNNLFKEKEIKVIGFPGRKFTELQGEILGPTNYDPVNKNAYWGFNHRHHNSTKGMSGGPVFSSIDHHLLGIYIEGRVKGYDGYPIETTGLPLFISVEKLWDLLEKPPLSCVHISCIKKAVDILRKQAESGDRQAMYKLAEGNYYYDDYYHIRAVAKGHPNAQLIYGASIYYKTGDTYFLKESANQGHYPALLLLKAIKDGIEKRKLLVIKNGTVKKIFFKRKFVSFEQRFKNQPEVIKDFNSFYETLIEKHPWLETYTWIKSPLKDRYSLKDRYYKSSQPVYNSPTNDNLYKRCWTAFRTKLTRSKLN